MLCVRFRSVDEDLSSWTACGAAAALPLCLAATLRIRATIARGAANAPLRERPDSWARPAWRGNHVAAVFADAATGGGNAATAHLLQKSTARTLHIIYYSARVISSSATQHHAGGFQSLSWCQPGCMEIRRRQICKLWDPLPDVCARRVDVFRVAHRVAVHPGQPLGNADQALVLPHHCIDRKVTVRKGNMKPVFAEAPIDAQDLHQELPHSVPHVLLDVTRRKELPHRCVYQGVPCAASTPSLQSFTWCLPLEIEVGMPHGLLGQHRPCSKHPVSVVPPSTPAEPLTCLIGGTIRPPVYLYH
mmetsp:Transcript_103356/g.221068  ORF Transcript_103356/g.221068 Transcript_103356/m.221068 type:complete len:303 (-) Transcript_103356:895-1803(-)